MKKGKASRADFPLPSGGEFVLGQSAHIETKGYDTRYAFLGEMGNVNIWDHVMNRRDVREIARDCELMKCGNAIEWADFRSGTRGAMKMRWPSHIHGGHIYMQYAIAVGYTVRLKWENIGARMQGWVIIYSNEAFC